MYNNYVPKTNTAYVCQTCAEQFPKWSGKCPGCGEWNSLVETVVSTNLKSQISNRKSSKVLVGKVTKLSEVRLLSTDRLSTGIKEFDRVLGTSSTGSGQGGFVPGQVVLLAGEPGIGKSTLLLQVAEALTKENSKSEIRNPKEIVNNRESNVQNVSKFDIRDSNLPQGVLYIAGEESPEQIKIRAQRLGTLSTNIEVATETDVDVITQLIVSDKAGKSGHHYALIIVDSVQTLTTMDLASAPGSVAQVRECAFRLTHAAKDSNTPLILVGHINKEGDIAGPKVLEHLVDTVLYLEGERTGSFRLLKAIKNRFGDPTEVGVFKMEEKGFTEVADPGSVLLETGSGGRVGSVVCATLEGNRPLMLEVQALTGKSVFNYPRRAATGYDLNRLYFILAVLEKYAGLSLSSSDVYINVAGGVPAELPAADLAIALSVVSCLKNAPLPGKTLVFGEVGLSGEVRHVTQEDRREKEGKRLGYGKIIGPNQVRSVRDAIKIVLGN